MFKLLYSRGFERAYKLYARHLFFIIRKNVVIIIKNYDVLPEI